MGNYGIKVAKSGYSITDSSPGNYQYHSSYPLLKIHSITSGHTYAAGSVSTQRLIAQIDHSLEYPPMYNVIVGYNTSETTPTIWYPSSYYVVYPALGLTSYLNVYTDDTYLYIYFCPGDNGNRYVYYKAAIYYDPLNP